ncbi:MAG: T9SS type A sorting domain-containing protein [Candidatus Symbiothrix sp.]|jgi:hypothetical protein|nr:T9SS type A sorting domain-containing protein [Candidatus Symbiothrix sp.]
MKKNHFLVLAAMFAVFTVKAQMNFKDSESNYLQAGVVKTILQENPDDAAKPLISFLWNFNTNKAITAMENPDKPGYLGTPQKASTRRGWRGVALNEYGKEVGYNNDNVGRCNNYQAGGDPVHFADVNALKAYVSSSLKYSDEVGKESMNNAIDTAAVCVFDMPEGGAAWAVYPGKYKKVDTRWGYNFANSTVTSDIEFDLCTYDPGNTGKTAAYKLVVTIVDGTKAGQDFRNISGNAANTGVDKTDSASVYGSAGTLIDGVRRYEFANLFTSSATPFTDKVQVKVAQLCGLQPSDFTAKKILIALITEGTGDPITPGKYDPVVALDNVKVEFWLETLTPPATVSDTWLAPLGSVDGDLIDVAKGGTIAEIEGVTIVSGFDTNVKNKSDDSAPAVTFNHITYQPKSIVQSDGANGQPIIMAVTKTGFLDVAGKMSDGKKTYVFETETPLATLVTYTTKNGGDIIDKTTPTVMAVGVKADGSPMGTIPTQEWNATVAINTTGANAYVVMSFPVTAGKNYVVGVDGSKMQLVGAHFGTSAPTAISTIKAAASSTKVIGEKGQIEIIGAQAPVSIYNITGQKVATVDQGVQVVSVPAGVYLVVEQNQRTVKVIVK